MDFRVGPWVYTVEIRDGLRGRDGRVLDGQADEGNRVLRIGGNVRAENRLDVLLHELWHAWGFHFPAARNAEEDAKLGSTIIAAAHQDLSRQGGIAALLAMRPAPADPDEPIARPAKTGASVGGECIGCGGRFTPQHIQTAPDRLDEQLGVRVVDRGVYCDFCGHAQVWAETATAGGSPTGTVIRQAELLKGEAAQRWLEDHGGVVPVCDDSWD